MKRYIKLFGMAIVLLAGCSKSLDSTLVPAKATVSVNVHGVNYTADPFTYVVADEQNQSNRAGGEHVGPYNSGGIMCCFTLPRQWKPGLRVNVHSTHWLKKDVKGNLPEVNKVYTLDVPRYPDGKVGELWVIRTAEGSIEVVISDVEPNQPEWPGKVKGWPTPSLDFQRQHWEQSRKQAESNVSLFRDALEELKFRRDTHLKEEWERDQEYHAKDIAEFSGPSDSRYMEYKKKNYIEGFKLSKDRLDQILKSEP